MNTQELPKNTSKIRIVVPLLIFSGLLLWGSAIRVPSDTNEALQLDTDTFILYQDVDNQTARTKQKRNWRCLLSLDGGGILCLSQIAILNEISKRIMFDLKLKEEPRLCDYFDMIGGVETGGLVAIFIGRLGLTVPQAKKECVRIMDYVSSEPINVTGLNSLLKAMVRKYTGSSETLMYDSSSQTNHCLSASSLLQMHLAWSDFDLISLAKDKKTTCRFGRWLERHLPTQDFSLMLRSGPNSRQSPTWLRWNNPSKEVIKEFEAQWARQSIACFTSIGSGHQGVVQLNTSSASNTINAALEKLATDSQRVAEEIAHRFRGQKNYFRLSVEQGVQRNDGQEALAQEDIVVHTSAYLDSAWADISVDQLIRSLLEASEVFPWQTTRDAFEQVIDKYLAIARSYMGEITINEIQREVLHFVSTLELIRKTDSNEDEWLNLAKHLNNHLKFFARDVFPEILEPLSADPLWASTNDYIIELQKVRSNTEELITRDPDLIWDSRTGTGESLPSNWATDLKDRFKDVKSTLRSETNGSSRRQQQETAKEKLVHHLSHLEPHRRHQDVKMKRSEGTGKWFLNSSHFQTWSSIGDDQIPRVLCSFGEPGAGKTMICSSVIEYLNGLQVAVAYLYCDYRDQDSQTAANMIGSLVKQLVMQIRPMVRGIWEACEKKIKGRNAEEMFFHALRQFEAVYVCIDALDECKPETRTQLLKLFTTSIGSPLRIFMTGRKSVEAEVFSALGETSITTIPIVANEEDIRLYLSEKLATDPYVDIMDEELKVQITETIVRRSHGIFLLATLQIQALLEHNTKRDRRQALIQIPAGLADTYTATLQRIKQQSEILFRRALLILTWVYYAERQLQVEELQYALAVKPGDTTFDKEGLPSRTSLVDCCLGLVVIEPETSTVRLTHFTLQEYFDSHREALLPSGHAMIAEICLTYLSFHHAGESREEIEGSSPFINYVGTQLGHHLRKGSTKMLDEKTLELLHKQDKFYILERFMEHQLSKSYLLSGLLRTLPLHWVAFFGISSIARLLLCNVDDINIKDSPIARTPLSYAAYNGHVEMIELLFSTPGVDIHARDYYNSTPLWAAASGGHDAIVQLLVDIPGVDVNARDNRNWTPLRAAASNGHDAIVQLLVNTPGVDVDPRDNRNCTPLGIAAFYGYDAVVQLLLNNPGVDVNARDNDGWTPLRAAACRRRDAVVQLLVNTPGVDVNARDNDGWTPLRAAAYHSHDTVVQLLINAPGVDVNARDNNGWTALWTAAYLGLDAVVQLLLNAPGIDVNARDKNDRTPFLIASEYHRHTVVRLLINTPGADVSGIDINAISDKNGQKLSEATSQDHESA